MLEVVSSYTFTRLMIKALLKYLLILLVLFQGLTAQVYALTASEPSISESADLHLDQQVTNQDLLHSASISERKEGQPLIEIEFEEEEDERKASSRKLADLTSDFTLICLALILGYLGKNYAQGSQKFESDYSPFGKRYILLEVFRI